MLNRGLDPADRGSEAMPSPLPLLLLPLLQAPQATDDRAPVAPIADSEGQGLGAADEPGETREEDYFELSLEELMTLEVEVTSVTRSAQRLVDSAAAVAVLTADDILRSGATSLAEVLRLVPGVQVARIGSNLWAISARGFNDQLSDKLLVLMDGRILYSPLFAGMFWDVQDYPLEDIERIEVVRGPGGAVWGANAVNGVINIITRTAHDTQGGLATVSVGTLDRWTATVRHGATLDSGLAYRVYARGFEREALERTDGTSAEDAWDQLRAGFRVDSPEGESASWTVQGDLHAGRSDNEWTLASFTAPPIARAEVGADILGGNLLGRYTRALEDGGSLTAKAYWDATRRDIGSFLAEDRDTFDLEFLHSFQPAESNRLSWGLGYRLSDSRIENGPVLSFSPSGRHDQLVSLFVHDEQDLSDDLTLIAGTKLEHNDFTGLEVQPNLRFSWRPTPDHTVWGAVSRAVATPSQADHDVSFLQAVIPGGGGNTLVTILGNEDVEAEDVVAYELGYRTLVSPELSLDLALYFNDYDNLVTTEAGAPFAQGGAVVQPLRLDNLGTAETYGAELEVEWRPSERVTLRGGYSWLELDIDLDDASNSTNLQPDEGRAPRHQVTVASDLRLGPAVDLSGIVHYVDRLASGDIPSYVRGDVVLHFRPRTDFELKLAGLGFFHEGEPEFGPTNFTSGSEVELAAYLQLSWRF